MVYIYRGHAMNTATGRKMRAAATMQDPRWASVAARDPLADGKFFYSVASTGVYCRPACAARPARPENVAFHATIADAEQAGFRPCKRCKPGQPSLAAMQVAQVTALCRFIESAEQAPTLSALAQRAGTSPYHLHRTFKAVTGLTPKAYASAQRARRLRQALATGSTVTDAIYDAGYNSGSRFYEQADQVLGMTASRFRDGGSGAQISFATGQCSLGALLVARSERGVCAVLLGDDADGLARDLRIRFPKAQLLGDDAGFAQLMARVLALIEAPRLGFDLPLDVQGTAFQQRVWQALGEIPAGRTASYAEVAKRIGAPRATRAVAQACAANPLAVVIPCHRVVKSDGALSGYRWGIERKRALLEREAGQ